MRLKLALTFIASTQLTALILTGLAAWFLQRTTPVKLADTGSIVAFILCVLGLLMARGASMGGAQTNGDAQDGVNHGALLVVSGLVWLGLVALAYQLLA